MDALILISIYIVLIAISSMPCLIVNLIGALFLPARYNIKPKILTLVSVVLALVSAFVLNIELEGGMVSVPAIVIGFSVIWSLLLLASITAYKGLVQTNVQKNT